MMEKTGLKILLLFLMLVAPGLGQKIYWLQYSAQREYGYVNVNLNNFSANGYTWYEAQDACLAAGGDLSSSMQNLNNLMYLPKYKDYWTGLNRLNETEKWVSANGTNLPKDYHPDLGFDRNKKCGGFFKDSYINKWFAENCGNQRNHRIAMNKNSGFICERKRGDSSPKTRPSIDFNYAPCPTGWTAAGVRKCFKLFYMQREISWKFAEGSCLSLPMNKPNLACPSTRGEIEILSYVIETVSKTRTWFGLRRMTNKDRWIWADNSRMNATYFHHYISQKLDYGYGFINKATDPAYSWDVSTEQDGVRATTISYACQIERPRI